MAEAAETRAIDGAVRSFLTFRMDRKLYALPAEDVAEVIRVPVLARVPQSPKSLLGVGNLRGTVLPIASLRGLLGARERGLDDASRAIVLEGAAPVALAVDAVDAFVSVESGRIETRQAELSAEQGEELHGAFPSGAANEVAKILDVRTLLRAAFVPREKARKTGGRKDEAVLHIDGTEAGADNQLLVTFIVAGQEYAIALDKVNEIVPAPDNVTVLPRAEAVVLGVSSFRDTLLPLLSLRGLLGFDASAASGGREKVVVTNVGGVTVGLMADQMRAIVSAAPELIEPTPSVLAARTGGEAKVTAIYRGEGGRRLISILEPELLFREDVMEKLGGDFTPARAGDDAAPRDRSGDLTFLVFRLGDDEFGLPIDTVDEVAEVPEQITRIPKTPKFLEGVVNLRGEVLPVVDQRRRFDMPKFDHQERRRLIVVRTESHRAGLIVDSVTEVLRSSQDFVDPAPDLAGEKTRLVHGVLNLEDKGRLILLLDPTELLSRAERELLDVFEAKAGRARL